MKFICPHCSQHLEADSDLAGAKFVCPSCANEITVPSHDSGKVKIIKLEKAYPESAYIASSKPIRSPHCAWLNVLCPGLGQIFLGQEKKGVLLVAIRFLIRGLTVPLFFFTTDCIDPYEEDLTFDVTMIWLFQFAVSMVMIVVSMVDCYKVGKRLQEGRRVRKWEWFPKNGTGTSMVAASSDVSDGGMARTMPSENEDVSPGTVNEDADADGSPPKVKCPHCLSEMTIGEDSEEYLVNCPTCGRQVDLTDVLK
jgi:DNA-directed RNA polymerase subunit M/transcription elongation factor TFIIS